jgi:radical SAM superfamily enzyme YgiQ (UPF0313 family)
MKITFIRPHLNDKRAADAMEPLVFAILAALTPPDIEIAFFDDRLELIPYDDPTDLVALTVETYTAQRAYQIASEYRQRNVPVVMGGYHPTLQPEEALQHAETVVIGDAEGIWPRLVQDAQAGCLQPLYWQQVLPSLDGLKLDRTIFQAKRYAPAMMVQYGRGCRFACDFCSIHAFYNRSLRQRPIQEVVAEIETTGPKFVVFVDDNLFANPGQAEELFQALIPLNIRWFGQVSLDIAQDSRLLDLMAKSGCITALIGLESLDERNLRQMKKGWQLQQDDYATVIEKFYDRGIMLYGTFVFGYDHDTPDTIERALDFALRSKLTLANFNPLTPTPATRLYHRLQIENRLIYDRWWLDPDFRYGQALFHPRGMTADELTEGCFHARQAFNRYSSILKRASANCHSPYHLGIFLLANLVSRKEIYNKQGAKLGNATSLEEPLSRILLQ